MGRKYITTVMVAGLAIGIVASSASAALNVPFHEDFTVFDSNKFGSGQVANYVPGEWEVLHGYALFNTGLANDGVFHLGHTGGVGPGHPGGTSAGFDLVAYGDSSNLYGEGTYSVGFKQSRSRLVFGWQDMNNYYFVEIARSAFRPVIGSTQVALGVRLNGAESWLAGWNSIGNVAETHVATDMTDVTEISLTWAPSINEVTIDLLWTNFDGTVVKFDDTVTATEPGHWDSGRFGPYFGAFTNGRVDYVSFVPEPGCLGLLALVGLGLLARRRERT